MIPLHIMHTTHFKINKLFQTIFKLIAIDLNLPLVDFSCELVQKLTRYRFIGAGRVILSNAQNDSNFT